MHQIVYHDIIEGDEIWVVKVGNEESSSKRLPRTLYHGALREILSEAGLQPLIGYDELGKPNLVQHPLLHLSISHRHNWLAFAISEQPIGIDVETFNANMREAQHYFMHSEERVGKWSDDDLLRIWCAKEALFKKLGGESVRPEVDFTVQYVEGKWSITYQEQSFAIQEKQIEDFKIVWI